MGKKKMPVTATVQNAWKDDRHAYLAVRVESDGPGNFAVEYIGKTPLLDAAGNAKSNQTLKAELVVACKAQRDAQKATTTTVQGITGTVEL